MPPIEYSDSTILKVDANGNEVLSSYVDTDAGEYRRKDHIGPPGGAHGPAHPNTGSMTSPTPVTITAPVGGDVDFAVSDIGEVQVAKDGVGLMTANDGSGGWGRTVLNSTTLTTVIPAGQDAGDGVITPDEPLDVFIMPGSGFGKGTPTPIAVYDGAFKFSS